MQLDPILFEVIRNALGRSDRGDVGLPAKDRLLDEYQDAP